MTLLIPSSGHGGPGSEPAALLSWVRRRFVRWLTGTGMKETRWSYAVKGELLVPVEARGSEEQKLALHDTGGAELDLHYHFPGAGLRIGAAVASDEDDAFPPGKTGRKLWAPADAEGDEKGGKLQSRAGLKRALLIDLHQLFGRRSLGGPASGAVMLLGIDAHCAAWVRKIGFHSQRLRQLVDDGRGVESGFSFEDLRDDVNTSFQETGFQAALFFDGVTGGRAGAVAYFGEITNATAEDHTSDAPEIKAAVQALSSLGKLAKTVVPQLARTATPSVPSTAPQPVPSLPVTPPGPPPVVAPMRAITKIVARGASVLGAPRLGGARLGAGSLRSGFAQVPRAVPGVSRITGSAGGVGGLPGGGPISLSAPPTVPSPPRPVPAVTVGDSPPLKNEDPHNAFLETTTYKDARANEGAPELYENGLEGGGFLYEAKAAKLEGELTLYRVGGPGKWWCRKPPPTTREEWRQRDAVCETWKTDAQSDEIAIMHIPKGVKTPTYWEGTGAPAYELDGNRKVAKVYQGMDNQICIGDTRHPVYEYLKTSGQAATDAAERARHHAAGKITITTGHRSPWVPP